MRKLKIVGLFAVAVLFAATIAQAVPQTATTNFVARGNDHDRRPARWSGCGGGQGGNGGGGQNGDQGGGNGGGRGGQRGPSSLVITADGANYKVVHKTQRGDTTSSATASGNTLTWTEERQGRDNNTMKNQFQSHRRWRLHERHSGRRQFNREFTAKRSGS